MDKKNETQEKINAIYQYGKEYLFEFTAKDVLEWLIYLDKFSTEVFQIAYRKYFIEFGNVPRVPIGLNFKMTLEKEATKIFYAKDIYDAFQVFRVNLYDIKTGNFSREHIFNNMYNDKHKLNAIHNFLKTHPNFVENADPRDLDRYYKDFETAFVSNQVVAEYVKAFL